jgi:3,4-dihydroxy-2-butanone 4-phosphate synthase
VHLQLFEKRLNASVVPDPSLSPLSLLLHHSCLPCPWQHSGCSRPNSTCPCGRRLAGKFVVVLDDEDRENEGDLIINADKVTPEAMAFMVEHTSGVICISMTGPDLSRLQLPQMVSSSENDESMYTAFAVTVDLREGTTTGISAADRAATLRALADPSSRPEEFRRPGHIFPLRYRCGIISALPFSHQSCSCFSAVLSWCCACARLPAHLGHSSHHSTPLAAAVLSPDSRVILPDT